MERLINGYKLLNFLTALLLVLNNFYIVKPIMAQQLAFPTAEGFGAYAQGGRGGDVYIVTNLKNSGVGSLRYGIQTANGPRTIVFAVSGTIRLQSELEIDKPYITIAGQTAPGAGICVRDYTLEIRADHIIVRYIRSRLGDESGQESDAISIKEGHNIIMDHCSASWSVDEVFSCSTGDKDEIDSVTVQWCIISEALNNSIHSKGSHGYGALIRGCYDAKYTYHHNLFAHNRSRNPRPGNYDRNPRSVDPLGLQFDFRNNVLYNWGGSRPGYDSDKESVCRYNYVGNYGIPGPDSDKSGHAYSAGCKHFRAYYSGNFFFGKIPEDQWSLVNFKGSWTAAEINAYKQTEPFSTGPIATETAQDAYNSVMAHVGTSLYRDAVDMRVINDVKNGTGAIIDSQNEVGGWPELYSALPRIDTDRDGMPDEWETEHGLHPDDPDDRNDDKDSDGYTNLEEYLNSLVSDPGFSNIERIKNKPQHFDLKQNYPNPFNPNTAISYQLFPPGGISDVNLSIYNLNGQLVRTLVQDEQAAGRYTVHWDGRDDLGQLISSGIYLYRLQAGDKVQTKRMLLMK